MNDKQKKSFKTYSLSLKSSQKIFTQYPVRPAIYTQYPINDTYGENSETEIDNTNDQNAQE